MKATTKVKKYIKIQQQIAELKKQSQELQDEVIKELKEEGLSQIKIKDVATVFIAQRVTHQVDEIKFRNWLDTRPEYKHDMFYKEVLDKPKTIEIAKKMLVEDGEVAPFISGETITEYVSVRKS